MYRNSLGRIISILSREIQQELKSVVEPYGISVGEQPYICELYAKDNITQDALASKVGVDKAAAARAVKSLEEKGFLIRKTDANDKRNKRLYLTDEGRELCRKLIDDLQKYNSMITEKIEENDYEMIYENLKMIHREISNRKNELESE